MFDTLDQHVIEHASHCQVWCDYPQLEKCHWRVAEDSDSDSVTRSRLKSHASLSRWKPKGTSKLVSNTTIQDRKRVKTVCRPDKICSQTTLWYFCYETALFVLPCGRIPVSHAPLFASDDMLLTCTFSKQCNTCYQKTNVYFRRLQKNENKVFFIIVM